ncbi:FAD-dependent oxidoreductase [Agrococcus terreus]|uniref:FAD-dependent oxidoreductase n=2 Tax=Agrococcus terreus TaxID=574649 RepID=A0ABQ2KG39_9MICO|nr:FAD-dependent oxidoreductase [Agrococcus terreus]
MGDMPRTPNASLWLDDGPAIALDEAIVQRPDAVVVGAGITGLSTAVALARQGASVLVLEARAPGAFATGSTTAKVSLLQSDRLHRILSLARRDAAQAFVDGSRAAQSWLLELLDGAGAEVERRSAVSFAWTPEGADALEQELEAARSLGVPAAHGGAEQLPFAVAGAIELEAQAQVQPVAMLAALAAEARAHGAIIARRTVRGVRRSERGVVVTTDEGEVRAGAAVLATGSPVPARITSSLLEAHRSYAAAYRVPGALPAPMAISVDSPSRSLRTARHRGEEVLVVGGPGHPVGRHDDPRRLVAELDGWVRARFPGAERTHVWSAQDYRTPDRLPWIGARPGSRGGILLATGFDKWGMTSGVLSALAIAGRLGGAEPDWARTLRRRGATPAALGSAVGSGLAVGAAQVRAASAALRPVEAPGEGEGRVGLEGPRLVATSTVEGETRSVSAFCPHVGALVQWNAQEASWDCSAHGSRFAPDGTRLEGPAACGLRGLRRAAHAG